MSYDASPYIGTDEHGFDCEGIHCRVTWHPRGGEPVMIEGDHLNNWEYPTLACGIEMILTNLDLWDVVGDHEGRIAQTVNWQLERHPWAEIECPQERARLELLPYQR